MERRDVRRSEGYYNGSSGHSFQTEFDDEGAGSAGSVSYLGDDARWKNDIHATHMNNDQFGQGNRSRGWAKHLGEFSGKGPKGYKRSMERIYEDACEALTRSPTVDASQIEVSVQDNVITLTGTVESRRMKKEAERVVDRVSGVDDVVNLLFLRGEPKGDQVASDGSPLGGNPEQESHSGGWPA